MKNGIFFFLLVCLGFSSCDMGKSLSRQLGFLTGLSMKYGGEFKGSNSEGCMKIEISNSPSIHLASDSLNFHLEEICRKYVRQFDNPPPCMIIEVTEQSGSFVHTSSSQSIVTDLSNTREFLEWPMDEYFKIRPMIRATKSAINDRRAGYSTWTNSLSEEDLNDPFNKLGMAFVNMVNGEEEYADHFIEELEADSSLSAPLLMRLGWYHVHFKKDEQKLIDYTRKAYEQDSDNAIYFLNHANALYRYQTELCPEFCSAHYERFPNEWMTQKLIYDACYKLGRDQDACIAIDELMKIKPEMNFPDSIIEHCEKKAS